MKIIQVGCGYWGESWLRFIAEDPQAELAALVSNRESDLKAAKEKQGLTDGQCFMDYEEALQKAEADLVLIVVPHSSHISSRKRRCQRERRADRKPLCDDLRRRKNLPNGCGGGRSGSCQPQLPLPPGALAMKEGVSGDDLEPCNSLQLTYRAGLTTDPKEHKVEYPGLERPAGECACYEICIHHFDMLRFLAGANVRRLLLFRLDARWGLPKGRSLFCKPGI